VATVSGPAWFRSTWASLIKFILWWLAGMKEMQLPVPVSWSSQRLAA
jgi:hypothetical protein